MGKEKALVTGCAGFIPGYVVEAFLKAGIQVVGIDDLSTSDHKAMADFIDNPNFFFKKGCVTDRSLMTEITQDCSYVYHGAVRGIGISTAKPISEMNVNIGGTLNILEACRHAGSKLKKVIIPSSASVYGDPISFPEDELLTLEPLSPYGVSKLATEKYALCYKKMFDIPVVTLRYFNTYGPRQKSDSVYGGVIPIFLEKIFLNKELTVFGDGEQTRDFTFIQDCIDITMQFMFNLDCPIGAVNVGTGSETKVNDIINILSDIHGKKIKPLHVDPRLVDNINRRCASIDKLFSLIGVFEFKSIKDGLFLTYQSSLNNR